MICDGVPAEQMTLHSQHVSCLGYKWMATKCHWSNHWEKKKWWTNCGVWQMFFFFLGGGVHTHRYIYIISVLYCSVWYIYICILTVADPGVWQYQFHMNDAYQFLLLFEIPEGKKFITLSWWSQPHFPTPAEYLVWRQSKNLHVPSLCSISSSSQSIARGQCHKSPGNRARFSV